MKTDEMFVSELSYEENEATNGGGPFWEDFGRSLGMIVGWTQNAGEWIYNGLAQPAPSWNMSGLNQVMLFQ